MITIYMPVRIVEARRQHFVPDPQRGLADLIGFDIFNVMSIIDDDDVGPETRHRRKRHRTPITASVIVELRNLRVIELNAIAPTPPIPIRFNQPAAGQTVLI